MYKNGWGYDNIINTRNINYLLHTYSHRVPGEPQTSEQETQHTQNRSNGEKHKIANILITKLPIQGEDKQRVHYLIDRYKDYSTLHHNATIEQVTACICYYVMLTRNPRSRLEKYSIFQELKVNPNMYYLIITRMLKLEQEESRLKYNKN